MAVLYVGFRIVSNCVRTLYGYSGEPCSVCLHPQVACKDLDIDMISLNLTERLAFQLRTPAMNVVRLSVFRYTWYRDQVLVKYQLVQC